MKAVYKRVILKTRSPSALKKALVGLNDLSAYFQIKDIEIVTCTDEKGEVLGRYCLNKN